MTAEPALRTKIVAEADRKVVVRALRTKIVAEADRKVVVPVLRTRIVAEADRKVVVPVLRTRIVAGADRKVAEAVQGLQTKTVEAEVAEAVLQTKTTVEPEAPA
jgi:hypothetical protein